MPEFLVGPSEETRSFFRDGRILSAASEEEAKDLYIRHIGMREDAFLEHVYLSDDYPSQPGIFGESHYDIGPNDPKFESLAMEFFEGNRDMAGVYVTYFINAVETGQYLSESMHWENPVFSDEMLLLLYTKGNWETVDAFDLGSIPRFELS